MKKILVSIFLVAVFIMQLPAQELRNYDGWKGGWNELAVLVKNHGDGKFEVVPEYDTHIHFSVHTDPVFFDFDNDGNLDLLLVGRGGDWRVRSDRKYAYLYRNMGEEHDYRFEHVSTTGIRLANDERYSNVVSIGDYDKDGYNDILIMSHDGAHRHVELYKNNGGDGTFTLQEVAVPQEGYEVTEEVYIDPENPDLGTEKVLTNKFVPMSNGSVMFGDLDNDGWLDIIATGWSEHNTSVRIYRNMRDGTFKDVTPSEDITGSFEGQTALGDINGNGTLDVIVTGHGDGWVRYSSIYYNTIDSRGEHNFRLATKDEHGLEQVNKSNILVADFNNDGLMDMVIYGTTNGDDDGFGIRMYYQKEDGTFDEDRDSFIQVANGGINLGDYNGDGNMDFAACGWRVSGSGYSTPMRIYENRPEEAGLPNNNPPSAPASVEAVCENGELTITWQPATDDISSQAALRYNIFVQNHTTDEIWMMIPADIKTGRLKVGTDLQVSLSSHVNSYTMALPEDGVYTVGVQALDQAFAGGMFATTRIYNNVGIITTDVKEVNRWVNVVDEGLIVKSEATETVEVFNINGHRVATGLTNHVLPVSGQGVYIVNVEGTILKVIK